MKNVEEFHRRAKNDSETSTVRKALQAAFTALDDDIAKGALPDAQGRVSRLGRLCCISSVKNEAVWSTIATKNFFVICVFCGHY